MSKADFKHSDRFSEKSLVPLISSQYFDVGACESLNDLPENYDPNRRSSLGAESLLEHDISEESSDLDDFCDTLLAETHLGVEYADDVFLLNRYKERLHHPKRYIEEQPQVTEFMRCTLINWLVKVNHELHFGPETIFIAVSLTDRFLASTPIAQDCLQLLAVCALFVAAKMEESVVPGISALVALCGSTYRHYHFRRMEALLLSTLRFELHSPTSWFFVTYIALRASRLVPLERRTLHLARYVIETCLASYHISQFYPSEQAASALAYSCHTLYSANSGVAFNQRAATTSDSDCVVMENCFSLLSGLNAPAANLNWTFHHIFSAEELEKINICFYEMKTYMRPFLNSYPVLSVPSFFSHNTRDSCIDMDIPASKSTNDSCLDADITAIKSTGDSCLNMEIPESKTTRDSYLDMDIPGGKSTTDSYIDMGNPESKRTRDSCFDMDIPERKSTRDSSIDLDIPAGKSTRDSCLHVDIPESKTVVTRMEDDNECCVYPPQTYSYYNEVKEIFERVTVNRHSSEMSSFERSLPRGSFSQGKRFTEQREYCAHNIKCKRRTTSFTEDPMVNDFEITSDCQWASNDCNLRDSDCNVK